MRYGGFFQHYKLLLAAALLLVFGGAVMADSATLWAQSDPSQSQSKSKNTGQKSSKKKKSAKSAKESLPWPQNVLALAGDGAILVTDPRAPEGSQDLYAHNAERAYVPASILKIVTTGAALEFLGPDYRFKTDFLLTKNNDLWVVGYGDPHLVSEELVIIAKALQGQGLKEVQNIYIDNSYFEPGLILDGNTQTRSAYDAYNLAFGVNFNTVCFQRDKKGRVSRAAEHIPLTPLALEMAAKTKGRGTFRLSISESPQVAEANAGQTLKAHLEEAGIPVRGEIITGEAAPVKRKVFYRHESTYTLTDNLRDLMKYSNNFMTNQIFLSLGAQVYGAPATLEKSQKAMDAYFQRHALPPIIMGDGSGLSRQTTLTARQMAGVLAVVEPDRYLFTSRDDGQVLCKTGTMSDIKTLAGYLERPGDPDRPLSFVILLNGPNYVGARDRILDILKTQFLQPPSAGK